MILGLVSDSHGQTRRLQAAIDIFAERGAGAIVHCGDIGRLSCLEALGRCGIPTYLVAGNTDRHLDDLAKGAEDMGVAFASKVILVPLGEGRQAAATHGDDRNLLEELIRGQKFPYLCHGHSHLWTDLRVGAVRVINPGALHRAALHTAAVLDSVSDTVEQVLLP